MIRERSEIKSIAKQRLAANRGNAVLIYLVTGVIMVGAGTIIPGLGALLATPITVGMMFAFLKIWRDGDGQVNDIFSKLSDYGRMLGGILWMELWIFIWSLLFVIPGLIKALAYSLTPLILVDCPNVPATEAIRLSMRITNGHKGKIFVFYLSYIGWGILSGLTFGILEIVHVGPYRSIAFAGLYEELKAEAVRSGAVTESELA